MPKYSCDEDIINKYDKLYAPVFFPSYLYWIFVDEHDYDASDVELADKKIMLTMGHYFSLEESDLNKAKYYYDRVTKLGSPLGMYSLGVFYYTKKMYAKAKLYATNGLNMKTKYKLEQFVEELDQLDQSLQLEQSECAILLFNIAIAENNMEKAEKYLLDEIEKLEKHNNFNLKLIEKICMFYLNTVKDYNKLLSFSNKYIYKYHKIRAIIARYYLDIHDVDNLEYHAKILISNGQIIGNYYMGMCEYIRVISMCKNNSFKIANIKKILNMSKIWFEKIIHDDLLKDYSIKMIEKLDNYNFMIDNSLQLTTSIT